jgi:hypothetical protein
MTARVVTMTTIHCDGRKIGTECNVIKQSDEQKPTEFRAWLRQVHQWTRRPWQDVQLDLCAGCSKIQTELPPSARMGGRPKARST